MNDQNVKDMGNLSRATGEMRKKLELSFTPQLEQKPTSTNTDVHKTINTDVNKSVNTDLPIYGNIDFKPTSINTEIGLDQAAPQSEPTTSMARVGSRYKKIVPRAAGSFKSKATFCLDSVAVEQLGLVYIKRLSNHQKSDRSSLICEAISLLFEKEKPI
jgi:hypothetical protein